MEKHRKKFSIRLIEKIGHDEEEREIIQYGLHQGFLILLNLLTTVVCGILWKELPFCIIGILGDIFFRDLMLEDIMQIQNYVVIFYRQQ